MSNKIKKAKKNRKGPSTKAPIGDKKSIDRKTVIQLIKNNEQKLKWPGMRDLMGVHEGADVDRLRKLKRRLLSSGELCLNKDGYFMLPEKRQQISGTVTYKGRGEWLMQADDIEQAPVRVRPDRALKLRSGDQVVAESIDGKVEVQTLTQRSTRLLFGRLVAYQKVCYVESEQPDYRGRVSIHESHLAGAVNGDRVAVNVTGEDRRSLVGEIVEVVARHDAVNRASTSLLRAYQVPMEWPEGVAEQVENLPIAVDPKKYSAPKKGSRVNLEEMPLVTIDGADSRDFDDAVHCESLKDGNWRLVVAIADVAHYVQHGSALDLSALERGNSVYLPDQVVPMLPEQLSNDLCSLRPELHRLALVCDMQISADGVVKSYSFYEALIRSWQRLTYTQVDCYLRTGELDADAKVRLNLDALHACFLNLNKQRVERGALEFDTQEVGIKFNDAGEVSELVPVTRNDAHKLIEEAMILANVCAAEFLSENKVPGLYRVHGGPEGEKLEQLKLTMSAAGISTANLQSGLPKPKDIYSLMKLIGTRADHQILEFAVLRSMRQAFYTPENTGHFGLALDHYAHFTSPIRRYADLLVHRAIKALVSQSAKKPVDPAGSTEVLGQVGEQISITERRAEDVGRDVTDWYKCSYAQAFTGKRFKGVVTGVTEFGLFIQLDEIWVQGLMHVSNLGEDYFTYVPEQQSLVGERSGRRFQLGQSLDVILADVDVESRKIDLLPPGKSRRKSRR